METGIHIGNKGANAGTQESADAIVTIFRGARLHSMDQHTVEKALEAFMRVAEVKDITIRESMVVGGDFYEGKKEDYSVPSREEISEEEKV